jgi:hypothetical protein
MSDLKCPICTNAPLGTPYRFAGHWLVCCRQCHSEIELRPAGAAGSEDGFQLTATMKLATLREAEQYRRRTIF